MNTAIKIATWNVNSLRLRLPAVLAWLEKHQPTLLCVQETKVEDGLFPLAVLQAAGWQAVFTGQKSYNGVAILSREPLTEVQLGLQQNPMALEGQSRVIGATVHGMRVVNVYLPQGEATDSPKFAYKQRCYAALQAELQALRQTYPKVLVCGDFNIATDARDIPITEKKAEKQVMFTPDERGWLHTLKQNNQLDDALRLVTQEAGIYSWYDYRMYGRAPHHGWRIDYHFVSSALAPYVKAVEHHTAERALPQPSDHVPVVVTLEI